MNWGNKIAEALGKANVDSDVGEREYEFPHGNEMYIYTL